jgi:hypothetical protein
MTRRSLPLLAIFLLAATSKAALSNPPPLGSAPLTEPTGLHLVVPMNPPLVFDLDSGRATRIRGVRTRQHSVVSALAVGDDAVLWVDAKLYSVRRGSTSAKSIGAGWEVAPATGGDAVWVKSRSAARRCVLRRIRLDGRVTRQPRRIDCSARLRNAGGTAAIVHGGRISEPLTGRTLLRAKNGIWAIFGTQALPEPRSHRPLILTDLSTGQHRSLPWPSVADIRDEALPSPSGRTLALSFGRFITNDDEVQFTDAWLLDLGTLGFTHLPDMPAEFELKRSGMEWSPDGRLVWLGWSAGRRVAALWKPGDDRIRVREVRIPGRDAGSDSFVVWPAGA